MDIAEIVWDAFGDWGVVDRKIIAGRVSSWSVMSICGEGSGRGAGKRVSCSSDLGSSSTSVAATESVLLARAARPSSEDRGVVPFSAASLRSKSLVTRSSREYPASRSCSHAS